MKLWLLKARAEDLPNDNNPWKNPYDKNFSLVIRAESEDHARQLAQDVAVDESHGSPWLYAKYSTCDELSRDGSEGVLLIDHYGS
ncbi:MAG: hypothetical protein QM578_26420 [Pantoea sp.]|uniref:hypothetical protein n=1 Tax=Pantoea sp. TaxID=69393 RepID=UPI0039E63C9A